MPKTIDDLPNASAVTATDKVMVRQGTTDRDATLQLLRDYVAPAFVEQSPYPTTDLDITANAKNTWIDTGYTITLPASGTYYAECSIFPYVFGATGDYPSLLFRMLLGSTELKGSKQNLSLTQRSNLTAEHVRITTAPFAATAGQILKIQVQMYSDSNNYGSANTILYRIQGTSQTGGDKYFGAYRLK